VDSKDLQLWDNEAPGQPHFGRSKNVGLCIKQLMGWVHARILWMYKLVQLDVALFIKITGLPIVGTQPEE
jgi:hypothetical protein